MVPYKIDGHLGNTKKMKSGSFVYNVITLKFLTVISAKLGELAIFCSKIALMTGGWSIENLERRLIINS